MLCDPMVLYGQSPIPVLRSLGTVGDVWVGNLTRSLVWCAMESMEPASSAGASAARHSADPALKPCNLGENPSSYRPHSASLLVNPLHYFAIILQFFL